MSKFHTLVAEALQGSPVDEWKRQNGPLSVLVHPSRCLPLGWVERKQPRKAIISSSEPWRLEGRKKLRARLGSGKAGDKDRDR